MGGGLTEEDDSAERSDAGETEAEGRDMLITTLGAKKMNLIKFRTGAKRVMVTRQRTV